MATLWTILSEWRREASRTYVVGMALIHRDSKHVVDMALTY